MSADELHCWRGARVKLLTEATCLQDAVTPHLERYLLRGRFDVEQTYQCAVSRRTSTNGARDDELAVLKSVIVDLAKYAPRTQKEQNLRGIPRFGVFRRRGETLAQELGGLAISSVGQAGSKGHHKTMPSA